MSNFVLLLRILNVHGTLKYNIIIEKLLFEQKKKRKKEKNRNLGK
jgi:hypothetical protein